MTTSFPHHQTQNRKGFTLIELILVIGIITIVAGVVIVAVAPRKNFISARDSERSHASKQVSQAIYARLTEAWEMPSSIPEGVEAAKPICRYGVACPSSAVGLDMLPPEYITSLPIDVTMSENSLCTGYMVYQEVGRPIVFSPNMGKLAGDDPAPESDCGEEMNSSTMTFVSLGGTSISSHAAISGNGRYVLYASISHTDVPSDTNGMLDFFLFDTQTQTTQIISSATDGTLGNGNVDTIFPGNMSPDGRYITFVSSASNLVPNDTNGFQDLFWFDRQANTILRVNLRPDGLQPDNAPGSPVISSDGRYVAFNSPATDLVTGDTNGLFDTFRRDMQLNQTTRVSVASDGTQGNGNTQSYIDISADGRYVAFLSAASNLVANDTNGAADIFVHDAQTGQTTRVSVASDGTQGNGTSGIPSLSNNGLIVTFTSTATNLVANDTNGVGDIFVRDLQTSQTTRVSIASDGTQGNGISTLPTINGDGRYIAFASLSSNLVSGDTNAFRDIFLHDRQTAQTTRINLASDGTQANGSSNGPIDISDDGKNITFETAATNLTVGDTDALTDTYLWTTP